MRQAKRDAAAWITAALTTAGGAFSTWATHEAAQGQHQEHLQELTLARQGLAQADRGLEHLRAALEMTHEGWARHCRAVATP